MGNQPTPTRTAIAALRAPQGYSPPTLGMPPEQNAEVDEEAGRPINEAGEDHHQVMRNPDGSMVMLLSPNNPYHKAQLEHEGAAAPPQDSGSESPPAVNQRLILEQFHGPLQLERMARVVRLLALFDMAFSLMHAMADLWPAAVAASVMSYSGYLGARLFRRDLTRVYLVYLTLFALSRVAFALQYLVVPLPATAPASLPVYLSLTAMVQLVIAHFVWRFYTLLPNTIEQARFVHYVAEQHAMIMHQQRHP